MKPIVYLNAEHITWVVYFEEDEITVKHTYYYMVWWNYFTTISYDIQVMQNSDWLFSKI